MTVYRSKVDVWLVALSVGIMAADSAGAVFRFFVWCADGVPAVAGTGCVGCVQHPL